MNRFDRYLLSQLLMVFGFFSLVLVLVNWINRAVILFDRLIANGNSAMVFLEFSALSLPNVIRLVLPVAAFAAAIYCANRLSNDRELVVVQASGYSPFKLARPVLLFGLIVGLMLLVLTNYLVPASLIQLSKRSAELESNSTSRLLQEGRFFHPADGVTFYIREISAIGELSDLFLSDRRDASRQTTYTARRAFLLSAQDGPKLIMVDGMAQDIRTSDQRLSTTSFSEFVFDIGTLLEAAGTKNRRARELSTGELLFPTQKIVDETRTRTAVLVQLGNNRISQSLLTVSAALIGFSALLTGGFSRFGLWRQITVAIILIILLKSLDNILNQASRSNADYWPLIYLAPLVGLLVSAVLLWLSARPAYFSRTMRRFRP
ncbi:MAG: LPS export ABC transporter permease LptF [Paracoccaceae bacterium]